MAEYGSLPFAEQADFLRRKLDTPTARWSDVWQAGHDRAFAVAGATKADLLADLHGAVVRAAEEGTTLATFRKDFEAIVQRHGWEGWTGSDTAAGRAWRTRVIYDTNLRASHAAGRYAQLQAVKASRPYWRYRHSPTVLDPRPEHVAWDGRIVPADDPWWSTHYPPNGWGCRCYVESLAPRDLERAGISPDELTAPTAADDTSGIDPGWAYAPGATVAETLIPELSAKAAGLPDGLRVALDADLAAVTAGATVAGAQRRAVAALAASAEITAASSAAVLTAWIATLESLPPSTARDEALATARAWLAAKSD